VTLANLNFDTAVAFFVARQSSVCCLLREYDDVM
jgi:hypothetical protein